MPFNTIAMHVFFAAKYAVNFDSSNKPCAPLPRHLETTEYPGVWKRFRTRFSYFSILKQWPAFSAICFSQNHAIWDIYIYIYSCAILEGTTFRVFYSVSWKWNLNITADFALTLERIILKWQASEHTVKVIHAMSPEALYKVAKLTRSSRKFGSFWSLTLGSFLIRLPQASGFWPEFITTPLSNVTTRLQSLCHHESIPAIPCHGDR